MILSLELEIKSLLEEHRDLEVVAEKLIQLFEQQEEEWTPEIILELARFFLNTGLHQQLIRFCLKHLSSRYFKMPWAYFIAALIRGLPDLEEDVVKFLMMGIEEELAHEEAAEAEGAERFIKDAAKLRSDRKYKRERYVVQLKHQLMDQLLTLRTQQLYEQEKILLVRLQKIFPGDQDILREAREHKERYALDILARRAPPSRKALAKAPPPDPDLQTAAENFRNTLLELTKTYPEMAFDFAMAAYVSDDATTAMGILTSADLTPAQTWFKLDVLIECRHFLEVLHELNQIELNLAHDPETFFATAYLRAQAYWGMGQKHVAIEILENLVQIRPHYRSSSALLDLWRTQ